MGDELAEKWLNTGVPSWLYRWLMPIAWVAAIVTSVIGSDRPCSVEDPAFCGPDLTYSLAMIACLASLACWWRLPRLAAVAGLVFMVLDLWYDDAQSVKTAWTIYGAGCLAILVALTWSRLRRWELLSRVQRVPVVIGPASPVSPVIALVAVVGLVAAGFAALGVMRWQLDQEQVHLDRAVKATAVVVGFKDDELILELPDGSSRRISSLDSHDKGDELPVLVDPRDADWVRLQAELADYTPWSTVAGGAWLIALLVLRRHLLLRRARPRRTWSASGLPVWIEPDGSMGFSVLPAEGSERVLGFIALELDDEEAADRLSAAYGVLEGFGEEEDDPPPPAAARLEWSMVLAGYRGEALLVGDLTEGAWPTFVLGEQILRPATPFRTPRRSPWGTEEPGLRLLDLPPDDEPEPDAEPDPDAEPEPVRPEPVAVRQDLPWQLPLSPPDRWNLVERFQRVVVTSTGLRIRTGLFTRTIDWRDVEVVEIEEGLVTLTTGKAWHVIARIPEDRLLEVAGVFETLRRQAIS
ncbi:PH domain-containing protein [Kribbella sp. NPDC056861]|uniref:PH domain-containing protein n=1 Tax=Kribbella sp. NPDC056861 TaxID=3154857 RepID=UPI00343C0E53